MKSEVKVFPRNFRSSSAAYRAIRQYEEKKGMPLNGSGLIMTRLEPKVFIVSLPENNDFQLFSENHPNVSYPEATFRYFPDGLNGEGYYELKTGERRRPNSKFLTCEVIFTDLKSNICKY